MKKVVMKPAEGLQITHVICATVDNFNFMVDLGEGILPAGVSALIEILAAPSVSGENCCRISNDQRENKRCRFK
jgi:hypothetical protein